MSDEFLHKLFLNNGYKQLHKWGHYFERFRGKSPTMPEIGVAGGGSLGMWRDGLKREGTFIERAKDLTDALNAVHTREAVPITGFTRSTDSISIYDSVIVFEKRLQGARFETLTQPMQRAAG